MAEGDEDRIAKLENGLGQLSQSVQQLVQMQQQAAQPSKEPAKPEVEEFDVDSLDEQQLENLSRKDFLKTIAKMTGSQVQKEVGSLNEKLQTTEERASQADLKQEVRDAMSKHPELPYFSEELKEMFQKNPNLSVDRMMTLIKAENPDKLKQAQEKLAESKEGKEGKEESESEGEEGQNKSGSEAGKQSESAGGGMSPGGTGTAGGPEQEGKMSMNEAVRSTMTEIGFDSQGG